MIHRRGDLRAGTGWLGGAAPPSPGRPASSHESDKPLRIRDDRSALMEVLPKNGEAAMQEGLDGTGAAAKRVSDRGVRQVEVVTHEHRCPMARAQPRQGRSDSDRLR